MEVGQYFLRSALTVAEYSNVEGIFNNTVNTGGGDFAALPIVEPLLRQIAENALRAVALADILLENHLDNLCFIRVDNKIADLFVALVCAASVFQPVAIRDDAAGIIAFLCQLADTCLNTDGGFNALVGCLPVAYVVQSLST